jgi:septin 3/9/12
VLYFIPPSGHSLSPLDITAMKKIAKVANVVPVIAKADTLTRAELVDFKKRIKAEIDFHGIKLYPSVDIDEEINIPGSEEDKASKAELQGLRVLKINAGYNAFCCSWIRKKYRSRRKGSSCKKNSGGNHQ